MVIGILEKTLYLQGLEKLFFKYNIREVYSFDAFDGTKSEGMSFHAITDCKDLGELDAYVDTVDYTKPYYTEQISGFVSASRDERYLGDLIYRDGVFFKTNGNLSTQKYYKEVYSDVNKNCGEAYKDADNDDLTELDVEAIRQELRKTLESKGSEADALFKLHQVYELGKIVISASGKCMQASDIYCKGAIEKWKLLLDARNVSMHNLYDKERVCKVIAELLKSYVFEQVSDLTGVDRSLFVSLKGDLSRYLDNRRAELLQENLQQFV